MGKMFKFKKGILFFTVVIIMLFVFTSCSFSSPNKVLESFLNNFKDGRITEAYEYLVYDDESQVFKNFMDTIISSQDSESEFGKLNKAILDKISDITYEITEIKKDGKYATVGVNLKYFDLYKAYEGALNEFLTKSLDFENLDNLYNVEYITNLLIEHINKLKKEDKTLEVNLVKDKDWKIIMDREFTDLLTVNSIKLIDSIKENVPIE